MAGFYTFSSSLLGGDDDQHERTPDWMSVRCADNDCKRFEGQYCCPALVISSFGQLLRLEKYQETMNYILDEYFGRTFFRSRIGRFTNKWIEEMKQDHAERISRGCQYRFDKLAITDRYF